MVQETNAVLVGVQGTVVPIDPGSNVFINDALTTALAALPAQGGDLYVLPGTAPYVFRGSVLVTKPNVTLHFSRGALLGFGSPGLQALVRVRAERFRCVGARVEQVVDNLLSGASCFAVESVGGTASDEASFVDCHFRMQQSAAAIVGFSCIRAIGPAPPLPPRRGLCVAECTFIVVDPGVQQTNAFTAGDPHGVCMVRIRDSLETLLLSNHFRGTAGTLGVHCGPLFFARGASSVIVSDNILRDLIASPTSGELAFIDIAGEPGANDLGSVVSRSIIEGANVASVVRVEGGRGLAMSSFNIGRMIGDTLNGLLLAPSASGEPVSSAAVNAGNLHNVNRADGRMIRAEAASDLTITGNAYSIVGPTQDIVSFAPGECSGVVLGPRQPVERKLE